MKGEERDAQKNEDHCVSLFVWIFFNFNFNFNFFFKWQRCILPFNSFKLNYEPATLDDHKKKIWINIFLWKWVKWMEEEDEKKMEGKSHKWKTLCFGPEAAESCLYKNILFFFLFLYIFFLCVSDYYFRVSRETRYTISGFTAFFAASPAVLISLLFVSVLGPFSIFTRTERRNDLNLNLILFFCYQIQKLSFGWIQMAEGMGSAG